MTEIKFGCYVQTPQGKKGMQLAWVLTDTSVAMIDTGAPDPLELAACAGRLNERMDDESIAQVVGGSVKVAGQVGFPCISIRRRTPCAREGQA
jgi:hypothetical protein